jgi:hypothetical protein
MSKANKLAAAFTNKLSTSKENKPFKESFEITKPSATSAFKGMFGEFKLTEKEQREIELILHDHYQPGKIEEERVLVHLQELVTITSEIKAINSQSILLHGERIKKAQNLLKDYQEGAFTKWLLATYGNRQTPYSMLQYYEFYQSIPTDLRPRIESMPKKAAYTLAARDGLLDRKLEIVRNYAGEKQNDIILLIQETFPGDVDDKRRKLINTVTIEEISKLCEKLEKRKSALIFADKEKLHILANRLKILAE